jgi:uncharacterized iron-regulated membrane protein
MRSLHRWLTTLFVVVLLFLALTGLAIQVDDLMAIAGLGPHPDREMAGINGGAESMDPNYIALGPGIPRPDQAQTPISSDSTGPVAVALAALRREAPGAAVNAVEWRALNGVPVFSFSFAGNRPSLDVDAITGAGIAVPRDPAAGSGQSFHDLVKAFHNGTVLAAPGIWLIFCTGLSLLVLSCSGLWVYTKMWLQRRELGRGGLFWRASGEPLLWRRLHRYISISAAIFLAYIAVTGMLLALDDIVVRYSPGYPPSLLRAGWPGGMAPAPQTQRPALATRDIPSEFARVRAAAAAAAHNFAPLSIKLSAGQAAQVIVPFRSKLGLHPALYQFDPISGAWLNPTTAGVPIPSPYVGSLRWHQILKRLHRGDIIGVDGRWVLVLSDLCLLYLATSGIVMYFQMLARRRKAGATAWFWS